MAHMTTLSAYYRAGKRIFVPFSAPTPLSECPYPAYAVAIPLITALYPTHDVAAGAFDLFVTFV